MPNLVTILGLCAGLTALRFAFAGRFEPAAALIVFAALLDGFDGLLARRLDAASPFGAELDSLADFFNFGVAPAFLVYQLALTGAARPRLDRGAGLRGLRLPAARALQRQPRRAGDRPGALRRGAGAGRSLLGLLPAFVSFAGVADAADLPWLVAPWLPRSGC